MGYYRRTIASKLMPPHRMILYVCDLYICYIYVWMRTRCMPQCNRKHHQHTSSTQTTDSRLGIECDVCTQNSNPPRHFDKKLHQLDAPVHIQYSTMISAEQSSSKQFRKPYKTDSTYSWMPPEFDQTMDVGGRRQEQKVTPLAVADV